MQRKLAAVGPRAFGRTLPFSEVDAIKLLIPHIKSQLKYDEVDVVSVPDVKAHIAANGEGEGWNAEKAESAEPGSPAVMFWNL